MAEKKYIDAEAFNSAIREAVRKYPNTFYNGLETARRIAYDFHAADVRPVVRATWRRYSPFTDTYECSNCGEQVIDQQFRTNFCPNCGADMREKS